MIPAYPIGEVRGTAPCRYDGWPTAAHCRSLLQTHSGVYSTELGIIEYAGSPMLCLVIVIVLQMNTERKDNVTVNKKRYAEHTAFQVQSTSLPRRMFFEFTTF